MGNTNTSYKIEYKVDVTSAWRLGGDDIGSLPEAKTEAGPLIEQGYIIRIQKVTTESTVVFTNADKLPAALSRAFDKTAGEDRALEPAATKVEAVRNE